MDLKGTTAIVTGGARGIGRGIAYELAREGVRVAIADLPAVAADREETVEGVRKLGSDAIAIDCDVRDLAQAVNDSPGIPAGADIYYPTSDAALRQPEHLSAVATLSQKHRVHSHAVYSTTAPDNLAAELAALKSPDTPATPPLGYCFWSPSGIESFAAARGFDLPPGPVVLVGGSTMRCWRETAPPAWRRAFQHDAETPLEWSLRFLERGEAAGGAG